MKIKLVILDKDKNYLQRITKVFVNNYVDKLEVYSFTEQDKVFEFIEKNKVDIFLADEIFNIDCDVLPMSVGFAYLVENNGIELLREQKVSFKFQKADLIYKQLLGIFSERESEVIGTSAVGDSSTNVIAVVSASGGTGSSTIAAALAKRLSQQMRKVLYLNLECFGDADMFFCGEGQMDFSDIIYALKGKNANLQLKIESTVKQDVSGVYFFSHVRNALDISEMTTEDYIKLIETLKVVGGYDYIIMDIDFSYSNQCLAMLKMAHKILFVSDGLEISNVKLERALTSLKILDSTGKSNYYDKSMLMYNRFSSKNSQAFSGIAIKEIGGVPRFDGALITQILDRISDMEVLDRLT